MDNYFSLSNCSYTEKHMEVIIEKLEKRNQKKHFDQ